MNISNFKKEELTPEDIINNKIDITAKIIHKGLFHGNDNIDYSNYENLKLDLDSILSVLLAVDLAGWSKGQKYVLFKKITFSFVMFLERYLHKVHIDVYYSMEKYKVFPSIYPDWCKERNKRFDNIELVELVNKILIHRLKKIQEMKSNFTMTKCEDSTIIQIYKDLELTSKSVIVFSRDPHIMCLLAYFDIGIFNGRFSVTRETYYKEKEYPMVHYSLIPAYYLIAGLKRNEYVGLNKYGKKRTEELINNNKVAVVKRELPIMKELLPYCKIFYLKEL